MEVSVVSNNISGDQELFRVVERYYKLSEARKKINDELNKLKQILIDSLPDVSKIEIGDYRVSVSKYTQKRPDIKAIELYLGDKYNNFITESTTTRVTVSKIRDE